MSLTNLIETRQKKRLPTFCAYIDFTKAFVFVNMNLIWKRLGEPEVKYKLLNALNSLYASVVNDLKTEKWAETGLFIVPYSIFSIFFKNNFALSVRALGEVCMPRYSFTGW